jgi:hypothetical protein
MGLQVSIVLIIGCFAGIGFIKEIEGFNRDKPVMFKQLTDIKQEEFVFRVLIKLSLKELHEINIHEV